MATPAAPLTFRRALPPLLAYHVLIVAGAVGILLYLVDRSVVVLAVGTGLLVAGIAVHVAVLGWTGSMAARGSSGTSFAVRSGRGAADRWCPACAYSGPAPTPACPRCGHYLLPARAPETAPRS